MSALDKSPALAKASKPLPLIVLLSGLAPLILVGVCLVIGPLEAKTEPDELILTWIATFFSVMQIGAAFVITSAIMKNTVRAIASGNEAARTLRVPSWAGEARRA